MGIAFDAPLALLLLVPALGLTFALHAAARRRTGKGRRRVALVVRTLLLSSLVFALAGFRLVLPVDGSPPSSSSTCRTASARQAARMPSRSSARAWR